MAGKETPPPRKGFIKEQLPLLPAAWTALNYATGFAATVAAIPVDLGIDIVRGVRWATGHRSPPVEGQEPIGPFPLTAEAASHMKEVGRAIDIVALLGMCAYGTILLAPQGGQTPPVEATPTTYYTPVPAQATETAPPPAATATPPVTWGACQTIGEGPANAYQAWVNLGSPPEAVFRNLAGPDADNSSRVVKAGNLPELTHKKDQLCEKTGGK